jgi:hypothetical protein
MKPLQRRAAFVALVLAVALAHLLLGRHFASQMALLHEAARLPPRLQATYVRTLAVAEAPATAKPSPPPRRRKPARPTPHVAAVADTPASAASAAEAPASVPAAPQAVAEAASNPQLHEPAASAAADVAQAAPPAASAAASQPGEGFSWPASTRIDYVFKGQWQGEVQGTAQVEWVHAGERYQVHVELFVGPRFAPLATWRMSSDGRVTSTGLAPQRYDQETKVAFGSPRRAGMRFGETEVQLANGSRLPRPPGLQDTASQFVQLTYVFSVMPQKLRAGESVVLPLALPRYIANFVYDVVGEETLFTRFGELQAFHVKPRREVLRGDDRSVEVWIAPRLQYLPVRIRIVQDEATWLDLLIDELPQQASR